MSPRLVTYLAMVEGLFAMRAVKPLPQTLEAEIASIHEELYDQLRMDDREALEAHVEALKARWGWVDGRPEVLFRPWDQTQPTLPGLYVEFLSSLCTAEAAQELEVTNAQMLASLDEVSKLKGRVEMLEHEIGLWKGEAEELKAAYDALRRKEP